MISFCTVRQDTQTYTTLAHCLMSGLWHFRNMTMPVNGAAEEEGKVDRIK